MQQEAPRVNKNQEDRGKQGIVVFSRVAQRDLFANGLIEKAEGGWRILVRNPWYTGTYLSTVTFIRVTINGHSIAEKDTYISLRGQLIPSAYAKNLHELWWGMGEVAELFLADSALSEALAPKNEVKVDIDMRTAFSYGFPNDTLPYRLSGELEARL
ncbi:MAG: DUF6379 domain-containing protein [Clostridiales bacterium]|jgi:hypothetical protein|nr:DUF6379 domain-containing protein [Clostridiales bacterium]